MSKETTRLNWAKWVQDGYLYPYSSRGENAVRGVLWLVSWGVGIAIQPAVNYQMSGSAYFIFSVSLALEFITKEKRFCLTKIFKGIFDILLLLTILGSIAMMFEGSFSEQTGFPIIELAHIPPMLCPCICLYIFIGTALAFVQPHKIIYDENAEREKQQKAQQEQTRNAFMGSLNGDIPAEATTSSQGGDSN